LLATGTHTGCVRIWDAGGNLKLKEKGGSTKLNSIKWNKSGTLIGGGFSNGKIVTWRTEEGKLKNVHQLFSCTFLALLKFEWQTDDTFSTCNENRKIEVLNMRFKKPIKTFSGHTGSVQSIQWDPQGKLLASGSQDNTVKVWSMDREDCLHDLKGHTHFVDQVKWSNTGPGTKYPNKKLFLASCSEDKTVKLWDVDTGTCLHTLQNHKGFVRSIDFSPDGIFFASGCGSGVFNIWCTQTGKLLKTHKFQSGIKIVCWSNTADKIAISQSSDVCLIYVNGLQSKEENKSILEAATSKPILELSQGELI
jgi:transducin (beta)-like 1